MRLQAFKPFGPQGDWAALAPKEDLDNKTAGPGPAWPVYPTASQLALDIYKAMPLNGLNIRHNEDGSGWVLISNLEAPKAGYKIWRTQAKRAGDDATQKAVFKTLEAVEKLPPEARPLVTQGLLVVAFGVTQEHYDQWQANESIRKYIHDGLVDGGIPAASIESSLPKLTGAYLAPYVMEDNWRNMRDSLFNQAVGEDGQKIDETLRKGWASAKNMNAFVQSLTASGEQQLFIVGKMPPEIDAVWENLRTIYISPRPFLSVDGLGRISIALDRSGDKKTFDQTLEALKCCQFKIYGSDKKSITARVKGYDAASGRVLLSDEHGKTLRLEDAFATCGPALRFDLVLPGGQTLRMVEGVQLIPKNEIRHLGPVKNMRGTERQVEVNDAFYLLQSAIQSKGGPLFDKWDPAKSSFFDWNLEAKLCPDALTGRGWEFTARLVYDMRHAGSFEQFVGEAQKLSAVIMLTEHIDMTKFGTLKAVYWKLRGMEGDGTTQANMLPSQRLLDAVLGTLLNSTEHVQHCGILRGMLKEIEGNCRDTAPAEWFEEPLRSKLLTQMYEPANANEKKLVEAYIKSETK